METALDRRTSATVTYTPSTMLLCIHRSAVWLAPRGVEVHVDAPAVGTLPCLRWCVASSAYGASSYSFFSCRSYVVAILYVVVALLCRARAYPVVALCCSWVATSHILPV